MSGADCAEIPPSILESPHLGTNGSAGFSQVDFGQPRTGLETPEASSSNLTPAVPAAEGVGGRLDFYV